MKLKADPEGTGVLVPLIAKGYVLRPRTDDAIEQRWKRRKTSRGVSLAG